MVRLAMTLAVMGGVLAGGAEWARGQTVVDGGLRVETWATGLGGAAGMAFLPGSSGDALVIQKDTGRVQLLRNRGVRGTVLDLPVARDSEQGLLGIALSPNFARNRFVYLYHTAAKRDGGAALANRISRFRWNGAKLVEGKTIYDLPARPGPNHDGGKIAFGPDGKLYAVVGDLNRRERTQNVEGSGAVSGSSVIVRLNENGTSPRDNPFFSRSNTGGRRVLNDIFAYGIRNSFGIAFDPVGKRLWQTENGTDSYDEVNVVNAGFNGGWADWMGPRSRNGNGGRLARLGSKAYYADPQFSWADVVAPTDLTFVGGDVLGRRYRNDLVVADFAGGTLYDFDLTRGRKGLVLSGGLADRVADNAREQEGIILGRGFGIVTDLEARTDGLYVLSLTSGTLYRISRGEAGLAAASLAPGVPEPGTGLAGVLAMTALLMRRRGIKHGDKAA